MGLTGLEPVTLRLSSACSNQLSYRPGSRLRRGIFECVIVDFRFGRSRAQAWIFKNRKSKMMLPSPSRSCREEQSKPKKRPPFVPQSRDYGATAPKSFGAGGKGIRTPDFQLAKLALYQLSYAPFWNQLRILECGLPIANQCHSPKPFLASTTTTSYLLSIGMSFCSSSSFHCLPS